jgi:Response regulator containing CheY-like receiver domain and AraC-type DNA-binding domain
MASYKLKTIIAEDEPAILRYVKKVIEEMPNDFNIIGTAYNGSNALKIILDNKPELVITDIMMPIMSGLELIEAARDSNMKTKFILLTGYEKFEYARQAINLGVTNYLLKPIDSDELKKCLLDIKDQIMTENCQKYSAWLRNMYMENGKWNSEFMIKDCKLYLFSAFFGSLGNSLYCNFHKSIDILNLMDFKFTAEIESLYGIQMYHFPGNYQNEHVFIAVMDNEKHISMEKIRSVLFERLCNRNINVTLCCAGPVSETKEMEKSISDIYLTVAANLRFNCNSELSTDAAMNQEIKVSEFVQKQIVNIGNRFKNDVFRQAIGQIVDYWRNNQVTQLSIQTDLRYIFQYALQNTAVISEQLSDVNDIIYYSYDYDDLKCSILYETDKIFAYSDSVKMKGGRRKALAEEVKYYLDKHYKEQITYKDFNELLGYNEKYITSVFKEQLGVSPSRYVLERRMELAKELLSGNKDILLRDVSEKVGYSDPLYFSRVFKTSVGISPSTYAKQNSGGD